MLLRGLSLPAPGRLWLLCVAQCCRRWGSAWQQRTRGPLSCFAQGVCRRPWSHGGVSYRCGGGSRSGGGSARVRLHVVFGDWAGSAGVASIVCVCGRCLGAVARGVLTMSPGVAGSLRQQRALPSAASRAVGSEWFFVLKKVASSSACMLVCSIPDSAAAGSSTAEAGSISPSPQSALKIFCCDVVAGSGQFWWLPRFPPASLSDFSVCAIALDLS